MKDSLIDEIDLKILHLLKNNARMSIKAIAEETNVSQPTISGRIDNLIENKIIKGFYTEIDNSIFENTITCYIEIEVSPNLKEELYEIIKKSKEVIECDRVTGEYSLLCKFIFKNTVEMDKYINLLQHYGRTKTQIVFSSIVNYRGAQI